ncbi:MAG: rod-binding protein [Acidobacteriia bacterium]|nr:rod-binding protein [Terriglobia bacterium]
MTTPPIATPLLSTTTQAKPTKVEDAAKQFEALLIGQMLRSAREAAQDDDEDSGKSTMLDVADQQFSQLLANRGGMGLAKMVVNGLDQGSATPYGRSSLPPIHTQRDNAN